MVPRRQECTPLALELDIGRVEMSCVLRDVAQAMRADGQSTQLVGARTKIHVLDTRVANT